MGKGRQAKQKDDDEGQLDLIASGQLDDGLCPPDKPAAWTLAQVKTRNPKDYTRAVRLLALGLSYRDVADACRFSFSVVSRIAQDEVSLVAQKERLGKVLMGTSRMAFDTLGERIADPEQSKAISAYHLALIGGIAYDKAAHLQAGGVSVSVNVGLNLSPDEYKRMMAGAMGSGGGFAGQKASASGATDADQAQPRELRPEDLRAGGEVIDLAPDTSAQAED